MKSFRHPFTNVLVLGTLTVVALALLLPAAFDHFDQFMNPRPYYSEFPGALKILNSRMNWIERTDGPRIYITGILTNQSLINWKELEFECRFFDRDGVLIDASTAGSSFTVVADNDSAFRISVVPTARTNDYASFAISITTARVAKGLF